MSDKQVLKYSFLFWEKRKNSLNISFMIVIAALITGIIVRLNSENWAWLSTLVLCVVVSVLILLIIEVRSSVKDPAVVDAKLAWIPQASKKYKKYTREDIIEQANSYGKRATILTFFIICLYALADIEALNTLSYVVAGLTLAITAGVFIFFHNRKKAPHIVSSYDEEMEVITHYGSLFGISYQKVTPKRKTVK